MIKRSVIFLLVMAWIFSGWPQIRFSPPFLETLNPANAAVSDWYSDNWTYRKKLTIDNTKVDADLTDFPVLVSRTDTDLRDDAQDDGDDILFTSSDGITKLDHEIESFDGTTGVLAAWVEVPSVANASDTVIYMYYGYGSATNQQAINATWDSNNKGVWHIHDDLDDATSLANTLTDNGPTTNASSAKIADGQTLDGTGDYLSRANDSDFDFGTGSFTVEGWFKSSGAAGNAIQYLASDYGSAGWKLWEDGSGNICFGVDDDSTWTPDTSTCTSGTDYTNNAWRHIVAVKTTTTRMEIFIDGSSVASTTSITGGTSTSTFTSAEYCDDLTQKSSGSYYNGCNSGDLALALSNLNSVAWRFRSVTVANGATITAAKVTIRGRYWSSASRDQALTCTLKGENVDNSAIFSTSDNPVFTSRSMTGSTAWAIPTWAVNDAGPYDSPDISSIVSTITSRAGWASGNALSIFCVSPNNSSAERKIYSWEAASGDATKMPTLSVTTSSALGTLSNSSALQFGTNSTIANDFVGSMDELRISDAARASGWVSTAYNNHNSPSTFYSTGSEETQVTFNQAAFRFFANADSADVGSVLADQDTAATLSAAGDPFRLRVAVHIANNTLLASGETLKLQYVGKGGGSCASPSGGTPASYTDITTLTDIAYKDNAAVADDATLTDNANDPVHTAHTNVNQTYNEANNFTNSVASVAAGEDMLFDFALYDKAESSGIAYCFRIVESGDTVLDTYDQYPQITTASGSQSLAFSISDNSIGFGTLSSSSARYATGDTSGTGSETEAHILTASTNATSGYVILVKGATLTHTGNASFTISAIGGSNTASSTGTEQFGLRLGVTSGNGTATAPYAASGFAYAADAATTDEVASGTGDGTSTTFSARYLGNIFSTTEAGSYTATLTYVMTATF